MASRYQERQFPPIGSLVRFKPGNLKLVFHGTDLRGKIFLYDLISGATLLVKAEDVDWTPTLIPMPNRLSGR